MDVIGTEQITTGTSLNSFSDEMKEYDYNNVNQLSSSTNPSQSFAYDKDGNMTQGYTPDGYVMTLTYDAENRLTTLSYNNGSNDYETRYFYSGYSMLVRVEKWDDTATPGTLAKTDETRFVRSGFLPIQERDSSNTVIREYTWGLDKGGGIGGLLDLKQNGNDYSYLYDGKGNVMTVLDGSQNVVASYRYDAFGNLLKTAGSLNQPFRFSTKRYDEQTGHYYYGYRFYNPIIGKWITRDPLGEAGGINLYGFVGNNALNYYDALGLLRFEVFGQTIDVSGSVTFLPINISWDLEDDISGNGIFPPLTAGIGLDIRVNPPSSCDEYFSPYVGPGKNLSIGTNVVNGKLQGVNISIGLSGGLPFGMILPNAFSK